MIYCWSACACLSLCGLYKDAIGLGSVTLLSVVNRMGERLCHERSLGALPLRSGWAVCVTR